jgi:DNA modification methylase
LDCSKRGGIVLDAFGGSGTTLIAAHRTGRRGYLIEVDPLYCDVIIRRYQKHVGEPARLVDGGLSFEAVAARRISGEEGSHV